jgi:hypothetical protein
MRVPSRSRQQASKEAEIQVRYEIVVVPPGGGEADFTLVVEQADHTPSAGEYLITTDPKEAGVSAFKVRYVTTGLKYVSEGHTIQEAVGVQAEVISHPHQSATHKRMVEMYTGRPKNRPGGGKNPEAYPESGY